MKNELFKQMNKKLLILGFLSLSLSTFSQTSKDSWLENNLHQVSIESSNQDFSDLQFLKDELADKKIVAIGEQTHKDGSTFEARSRLVQFLVQEMNFEVILFESGMFDVKYGANLYEQTDSLRNLKTALLYDWRISKQHENLFSFFESQKKENKTLEFGGVDCKFSSKHRKKYVSQLDSVLNYCKANIQNNQDYLEYRNILEKFCNATGFKSALPKLSKKEKIIFTKGSNRVQNILKNAGHSYFQIVKSYDEGILLYSKLSILKLIFSKETLIEVNNQRDVLMAENLNYLLENVYKDKKVILFGATYHYIRNNQEITRIAKFPLHIEESTIMGHLMHTKYKKDIYTIGFTAYEGNYGLVKEGKSGKHIEPAQAGSLEKTLADYGVNNGILLLNSDENKPDWWYQDISIRLFTYNSATACKDWSKVLDAVFFIKKMKPNNYK